MDFTRGIDGDEAMNEIIAQDSNANAQAELDSTEDPSSYLNLDGEGNPTNAPSNTTVDPNNVIEYYWIIALKYAPYIRYY